MARSLPFTPRALVCGLSMTLMLSLLLACGHNTAQDATGVTSGVGSSEPPGAHPVPGSKAYLNMIYQPGTTVGY